MAIKTPTPTAVRPPDRTTAVLRPLGPLSWRSVAVLVTGAAGLAWFAQAWAFQLRHGMIVTGLGDWGTAGGVPWGIYVGSFIWWVGIAHGGIIVSAAVRLFRMDAFKPIARLAELLTLAALANAGLYIIVHLGRPDRVVTSILPTLGQTMRTSPLAWDLIVITLYFVLTATYVTLTLRSDLHALRDRLPKIFTPLYRLLLIGHRADEQAKAERMAWWLALALIVLAPLFLHGGVIPWLFALLPGQPGWFGPVQGPQFLAAALASALSAVTILAYVFRRAFHWSDLIGERVFAGLSRWMGLFALLFLWLQLQQIVTSLAMSTEPIAAAAAGKLAHPAYWLALGLLAIALGHAGVQMLAPRLFSVPRTAAVAVLPLAAIYIEKTLFVIEGLMYPAFRLYEGVPGTYVPSWIELSSIAGALGIVMLFFLAAGKAVPLIELEAVES
jgi:Ni/Fe-hydrogenase subunit HybB-like protein